MSCGRVAAGRLERRSATAVACVGLGGVGGLIMSNGRFLEGGRKAAVIGSEDGTNGEPRGRGRE